MKLVQVCFNRGEQPEPRIYSALGALSVKNTSGILQGRSYEGSEAGLRTFATTQKMREGFPHSKGDRI